jgi:hypothetical protein
MATSPPGSASARKSDDVMADLEVRTPVPSAHSKADVMDQMLAVAREGHADPAAKPDALSAKASPTPAGFAAMEVRKPPGPQAKPPPPPLKGPAAAAPPKGPAAAAAAAAAGKAPAAKAVAGQAPPAQPNKPAAQAAAQPATPPAAAAGPPPPPTATALIDDTVPWLPDEPERKAAFLQVYRYWHAQVRPEYAHKARPAFLFLVTALPVMVKARDDLKGHNLWEPPGEQSRQARDVHPAWKKYCEFLPRATQALQELDDYRHLSLLSALDDLNARVSKAEKKFREGIPGAKR